jgi:hypothetical protein
MYTTATDISGLEVRGRGAAYLSGGVATNLEVDKQGILQLCSGTTASDIVVHTGGHCYIGEDAVVTGEFTIETGATILAFSGSELNFSIAGRTAESDALVTNFSLIRGKIDYTITVSADQSAGVYRLADGVKSFKGDMDLTFGDVLFENLALDQVVSSNGMSFELTLEDNSLYLELTSWNTPAAAAFTDDADILAAWNNSDYDTSGSLLTGTDNSLNGNDSDLFKNGSLA